MKRLNKDKKFSETLHLFDSYMKMNPGALSSTLITQALKACTQVEDQQQGLKIRKIIPNHLITDPYVLPSLIHFYSL